MAGHSFNLQSLNRGSWVITKEKWIDYFENGEDVFAPCHSESFIDTHSSLASKLFGSSSERKNCIGSLVNLLITQSDLVIQDKSFENSILKYKAKLPNNIESLRKKVFNLVKQEVINNENVQQLEFKGQKLVVELFSVLATDPMRFLPKSTKELYEKVGSDQEKMRVICDFVSGMTDDYAARLYEKVFYPRKGSIFDRL